MKERGLVMNAIRNGDLQMFALLRHALFRHLTAAAGASNLPVHERSRTRDY